MADSANRRSIFGRNSVIKIQHQDNETMIQQRQEVRGSIPTLAMRKKRRKTVSFRAPAWQDEGRGFESRGAPKLR